CMQGLAFPLTF
nr:immunoglobulin light chain junction region [Macaca mulatta]